MRSDRPPRPAISSAPNLRDLGGWPTADGSRIRSGVVFRSAGLDRLAEEDLPAFGRLGIATVFDLRTTHEIDDQPDQLPDGIASVQLDVLADADHAAPAELQRIFSDPALAGEQLGDGQAERYFESAYRSFVTLPSARVAYQQLFEAVAEAEAPVLFHCATGKDRTGWATAVLYSLLGVSDAVVMEEYLLTNTDLLPAVRPWIDQFAAAGGDPALLMPILGVQPSYLEAALEEMRTTFGTVEEYAATGLGLSSETVRKLRERLLEQDVPDISGTEV